MTGKLLFLGTGAADINYDFVPEKSFADKSFRRCSCALVNGHILLDCGPFAKHSLETAHVPLADVTDVIFTHLHSDHFSKSTVEEIARAKSRPLHVWARFDAELPEMENCVVHKMDLYREYDAGDAVIASVPANHTSFPQHILLKTGGKKMLYATDGAWILGGAVNYLKNACLDDVVLDCTVGDYVGDYRVGEHNSIPMIRLMMPSLLTNGIVTDQTKVLLTHLAMSLHKPYEKTVLAVKDDGYTVAYDGFETEL